MKNNKIQLLKGIAIISVVLIHTCPEGMWQVTCRPFINFAVAMFLFLSGYLTKAENDNWFIFCKKRILRVLIPYILWSVLYTVANGSIERLLLNLLTAKSCVILYYIFVYIQFVLLTPLMIKLAQSSKQWIGWLISPISLILFKYICLFLGMDLNKYVSVIWDVSCLGWFVFYYLGLILGNNLIKKEFNIKKLILLYCFSLPLQMIEGYLWLILGEYNCGSQLKLSALLTSTLFMLIAYVFIKRNELIISNKFIILLGDYSFGIYLSHILVMKLLEYVPFYNAIPYVINSIIVVVISLTLVCVCSKICGKTISKWIGFQ